MRRKTRQQRGLTHTRIGTAVTSATREKKDPAAMRIDNKTRRDHTAVTSVDSKAINELIKAQE